MTKKAGIKIEPQNHVLVPLHEKLSNEDKSKLLDKYDMTINELPRMFIKDPAISHLEPDVGDVIKVTRTNKTAHETVFYRRVIDE